MAIVSTIIPSYNSASTLAEAIDSVLAQTRRPDEIIVVDDGSTDETSSVCSRFHSVVQHIRQPNSGVAAARNRGVLEARGDLIAFLDADDTWDRRKLQIQLAALSEHPHTQWCAGNCQLMDTDGTLFSNRDIATAVPVFRDAGLTVSEFLAQDMVPGILRVQDANYPVHIGDAYRLLFYGSFIFPSSVMITKSLYTTLGGFDEAFGFAEDTEFFHRVANAAHLAFVTSPIFNYRIGQPTSRTAPGNTTPTIINALESNRRAARIRLLQRESTLAAAKKGRQLLLLRLAYAHLSEYRPREARLAITEAFREGASPSPRAIALLVLTCFPRSVLRLLHRLKRSVR